VAKKADRFFIA